MYGLFMNGKLRMVKLGDGGYDELHDLRLKYQAEFPSRNWEVRRIR